MVRTATAPEEMAESEQQRLQFALDLSKQARIWYTYTQKQNQHRCLTSCLIRSLVRHLEAMVLQLHEYLMRCLSDIHTSPHLRKRPNMVQVKGEGMMGVRVCIW